MKKICLAVAIIVLVASIGSAQDVTIVPTDYEIPETNGDLIEINLIADSLAFECLIGCSGPCPKIDCNLAAELIQEMRAIESALNDHMIPALDDLIEVNIVRRKNLINTIIIDEEQLSNAEQALIIQNALSKFAKIMLDAANLADTISDTVDKVSRGEANPDSFNDVADAIGA